MKPLELGEKIAIVVVLVFGALGLFLKWKGIA